jgi:hypothetical protein
LTASPVNVPEILLVDEAAFVAAAVGVGDVVLVAAGAVVSAAAALVAVVLALFVAVVFLVVVVDFCVVVAAFFAAGAVVFAGAAVAALVVVVFAAGAAAGAPRAIVDSEDPNCGGVTARTAPSPPTVPPAMRNALFISVLSPFYL